MRFWIAIGAFLGVLILAFVFSVFHTSDAPLPEDTSATTTPPVIRNITVSDTYDKGTHLIHGTAEVPTPCTELIATSTQLVTENASTTTLRIDLSAEHDTGTCLSLPSEKEFEFSVSSRDYLTIEVYVNGIFATSTD